MTAPRATERSWLYVQEAQIAQPMEVLAVSRVTYTTLGSSATRPFASNSATPGALFELGGEIGLLPRLSFAASAIAPSGGAQSSMGAIAGMRVSLLPERFTSTRASIDAGYLRDVSGNGGAWGRIAFSQDIDRLRLGSTLHVEHIFASGKDSIDFMAMAGANVRMIRELRAGVEYVGQDLEESLTHEAEGGVRHFIGPDVSILILDNRVSVTGGPAFGLSPLSPRLVGRLALAASF